MTAVGPKGYPRAPKETTYEGPQNLLSEMARRYDGHR